MASGMARSVQSSDTVSIRLVTLNVRYATKNPVPGEEPWSIRSPKLCAQLKFITSGHSSAFLCLQEVLYSQLIDIQARLGPSWGYIGVGRDDGQRSGEFSPIFFRVDQWVCQLTKTYWLSKTPEIPSVGWDAALKRVCTVGSFRHKKTGTDVVIMSTHFDHHGETAREESAKLIIKLARVWAEKGGPGAQIPLFLGGDFNSAPGGRAYKALTSPNSAMKDISELVPDDLKYGNQDITYTSFGEANEEPKRIDFLFAREPGGLAISGFGILSNRFDDQVYLSDHRPVVADVEIPLEV
ncbi:Endonuclease/exonuclease/phosphatase [Podospora appendiculata]|uniref:Endonuclease/exonuclease/phosphatase n=1 Tax=Podospora appendiculata TaxID=314037 RepID=A0AAE0X6D5_9PEZI|nr:Endonuclease/exonuclease/phosphatase [Podospora appendiculata]